MRPRHWCLLLTLLGLLAGALWIGDWRFPSPPSDIQGQVTDGTTPLSGARVRFRGRAEMATTDEQGYFHLARSAHPTDHLVVAKEGYVLGGISPDQLSSPLVLARLPAEDHEDYSWIEPGPWPAGANNCVNCHPQIFGEWKASAHARSATNRRFLNLYDGSDWHGRKGIGWDLRADNRDGAAVCSACHAPTVSPNDAAFADLRKVRGVDKHGVHCDFCHKIADAATDERGLTFGRFGYTLLRPRKGQFFFGPLDDAQRAGESFAYASVYRNSRYCASCHEGVIFGVPVYSTYSEWLASPARKAGQSCQSCHMAPTGTFTNIAPGAGGIERDPQTLAAHRFPGAQAGMLRGCLAVSGRLTAQAEGLLAQVEVRADRVGHRVPTGFIDRNLLLVVEAFDRDGRPVALKTGTTLPGLAGKGFAGRPGRLYAKQLRAKEHSGPVPFWRHHGTIRDTRLFPSRPDKADFLFRKEVDRVRVRLIYRRFWKEVADTKGWPENETTLVDRIWHREKGS